MEKPISTRSPILFSLFILAFTFLTTTACLKEAPSAATPTPTPTLTPGLNPNWVSKSSARIFVSGHSLTDDPFVSYIGDIALKKGDSYNYNQQIVLGSPIRYRTEGGDSNTSTWEGYTLGKNRQGATGLNVVNELLNPQTLGANERYNTLVIAENHNLLDMIRWENTLLGVRHYHDRLIAGNAQARSYLYHTWLDLDKTNPTPWINYEKASQVTWECVSSKVNESLQAISRADRITALPASGALVDLVERAIADQVPGITGTVVQKLDTIFIDNVHTTTLGMYYMALVTYSAVYGKSPESILPPGGISATTAAALQSIAWNYINTYYNRANPGVRTMTECRNHTSQNVCTPYFNLKATPQHIASCQSYFSDSSASGIFSSTGLTPWPSP